MSRVKILLDRNLVPTHLAHATGTTLVAGVSFYREDLQGRSAGKKGPPEGPVFRDRTLRNRSLRKGIDL
jgi:hypothetical protein